MLIRARGFSLVELMVAISLLAVLIGLAMPGFMTWIRNTQVRTVAEALQSGTRLAQAEAVRRYRQVVFFRTNQSNCDTAATAEADGAFWVVRTIVLVAEDVAAVVQCGNLSDVAANVAIGGPTAICFSSAGRQVAVANPGIGGTACTLDASGRSTFDVNKTGSARTGQDRPLRVLIGLAGSVRMCDPAKALSATNPDGCPS